MERVLFVLLCIAAITSGSLYKYPCKPVLQVTDHNDTSITVEWTCNDTLSSPTAGYNLVYWRLGDRTVKLTFSPDKNKYTFKRLRCGTYAITVAAYDSNDLHSSSHPVTLKLGLGKAELDLPLKEEFLDVGEDYIIAKLDRWKFHCPPDTLFISISGTDHYNPLDSSCPEDISPMLMSSAQCTGLEPNTEYSVTAYDNVYGWDRIAEYTIKTLCSNKTILKTKSKDLVLTEGNTDLTIHLEKFDCFDEFTIEYRESNSPSWILVSNDTKREQKMLLIQKLSPGTSYNLRVTGRFKYGERVDEYNFSPKENVCGTWLQFKKKCIKPMVKAGLVLQKEAKIVCQNLQENVDVPTLLSISSKEELEFVSKTLLADGASGYFWLGLYSEDGKLYRWDDGTEVGFTNWGNHSVSENGEVLGCGRWHLSPSSEWEKTTCSSRNSVVCQKPHPWSTAILHREFAARFAKIEERLAQADKTFKMLKWG